jgi:thymidine kinase
MAKLYFRYGTVGSAKTLNLLAVAHNYSQQQKRALLIKPDIDTRFGKEQIRSRSGLEKNADLLVTNQSRLAPEQLQGLSAILVDEAQFLDAAFIDHLKEIAVSSDIPVICYGLRTDFKTQLFEGSHRLLEVADSIEEVKTTCHYCNRKAIFNLKLVGGKATLAGPKIELGAEELYLPACSKCYFEKTKALR